MRWCHWCSTNGICPTITPSGSNIRTGSKNINTRSPVWKACDGHDQEDDGGHQQPHRLLLDILRIAPFVADAQRRCDGAESNGNAYKPSHDRKVTHWHNRPLLVALSVLIKSNHDADVMGGWAANKSKNVDVINATYAAISTATIRPNTQTNTHSAPSSLASAIIMVVQRKPNKNGMVCANRSNHQSFLPKFKNSCWAGTRYRFVDGTNKLYFRHKTYKQQQFGINRVSESVTYK